LVTCFNCDEAYHFFCHTSRVTISKSNSKWYCNDCTQKQHCKTNDSQNANLVNGISRPDSPSNTLILPPVLSPQVSPTRGLDQVEEDGPKGPIDPNIPDARNWTSEQVYQYFARLFPKEAEVFRQQVTLLILLHYACTMLRYITNAIHIFVTGNRRPCAFNDEPKGRAVWT